MPFVWVPSNGKETERCSNLSLEIQFVKCFIGRTAFPFSNKAENTSVSDLFFDVLSVLAVINDHFYCELGVRGLAQCSTEAGT